jgi:membrane-associated phospholipid phosphatase
MFDLFYNFLGLNQKLFLLINHGANTSILPYIFQTISWFLAITHFATYYIIYCIYSYISLKKIQGQNQFLINFWNQYNMLGRSGLTYAIYGLVYAILKFSINLPRPFCSLAKQDFMTIANTASERCLSSFPSSHTGLGLLIAYFIWPYLSFKQKIIAILGIVLVAISRIALAMHYPADIIYSCFIATMVIIISNCIYKILINNIAKIIGRFILKLLYNFSD